MQTIKLYARDKEVLEEVRTFLAGSTDAFPSLRVLCRKSGLNADKLKKGFKLLFGQGPYGYHLHLRMEEAKRLLAETDEPVCAIAWTLGYEHASNFCIRFKKIVGCTPGAFRLKHSIAV